MMMQPPDDPKIKRDERLSELATLQVRHTDAANGYDAGLENADATMDPVLRRLSDMHRDCAEQTARILVAHGGEPDPDGSWLSWVHRSVMVARGMIDGLGTDVIPGLIDGEKRVLEQLDRVLEQTHWTDVDRNALIGQRDRIEAEIAELNAMKADTDGATS